MKLPKPQLIGLPHTQPFAHGDWLFAHNGTLFIPREVAAALGSWARCIKGRNDSEVLFYWLMKTVIEPSRGGRWAPLLCKSLQQLDAIWVGCRKRYPLYPFACHGLNWLLTDGRVLLGFCYVNPRGFGQARALCNRRQPYYQMHMKRTPDTLAIASEPLTRDNAWQPLQHGQLVVAQRSRHGVSMRTYQVLA